MELGSGIDPKNFEKKGCHHAKSNERGVYIDIKKYFL
jgi:hypothetical protein